MINNKVKTLLFIFILLFCIAAVNADEIEDIDTTSNVDIIDVKSDNYVATITEDSETGTFTELNNTINSNYNESIDLTKNYTYNDEKDSNLTNGIIINRTLTIDGHGFTIDGNHTARIFNITAGSLTIKNINIVNGSSIFMVDEGGVIYNNGDGILTVINSTFKNNFIIMDIYSRIGGGAIYSKNNVTIINSTFINNTVNHGSGGAIYSEGNLTVVNSTFDNNNASGGGAAIGINNASLFILNSKFNNNYGKDDGGAIRTNWNTTIINSAFENNYAYGHGGAIFNNYGTYEYLNILTIVNSTFFNNSGLDDAGAIFSNSGDIINCDFINNSANYAGAVGLLFGNIVNSTFINNTGHRYCGAVLSYGSNIIGSTFMNNNGGSMGGAVLNTFGIGNIKDTKFVNNSADIGGAIYNICGVSEEQYKKILAEMEELKKTNYTKYLEFIEENKIELKLLELVFNGNFNIEDCEFDGNQGRLGDDIYTSYNTTVANNTYTKDSEANIYANNTIIGGTVVTILGNGTYYVTPEGKFMINATVYIDGATYEGYTLTITDGEKIYNTVYKGNGVYELDQELTADFPEKLFSAIINGDKNNPNYVVRTSIITTLKNITIVVDLDDVILGENITGNVTLKEEDGTIANFTGQITVTVDGEDYTVDIVNGTGRLNVENKLSPGNYSMEAIFNGSTHYYPSKTNINFTVSDPTIIIVAYNLTKYYGNSSRFIIMLTDSQGNPIANQTVNITINGVTYTRTTDENGTIMMGVDLIAGVYEATVSYENITQNATITVLPTIEAEDLIKYFKNGTQYYAKFFNLDGTPLANTNVTFNIHGVFYTRTTDENGIAKLNINLNPGEYIITAFNPVNNESKANTITVLSTIFGENVIKFYRNGTQYYAYVLDENGTPLANANVTFNIHGVFYNRTTDNEGMVKLNINLNPGEYIITAWNLWNGEAISNNITVYNVVLSEDLEMTTSARKPFKVTILGEQGKPLANAQVSFNIYGVFYYKTTDANGQVSLDINLIAGKYIITTYYNEYAVSNTIVVK